MRVQIFTAGGTIDKIYFDDSSEFQVGDPQIGDLLKEANVSFDYAVTSLMKKDSLDMTDADRQVIREAVAGSDCDRILVTHGTDTMADTARSLLDIDGKVIVLTGAMQPARLRVSDAIFNIGFALGTLEHQQKGVYVAMNGIAFEASCVRKNRERQRFEVN